MAFIAVLLVALVMPGHAAIKVTLQKNQFDPVVLPAGAKYYPDFSVRETKSGSFYYEEVDPGHLVYVQSSLSTFASGAGGYSAKKLTILSITGAEVDTTIPVEYYTIPPDLGQTAFYMNAVPYVYLNATPGFVIPLRANAPKAGAVNPVPIVIKARFEGDLVSIIDPNLRTPVDEIYQYVVPVSKAPALEATASFTSINPGELRPDGAATISYQAKASAAPITDLSFHARIPSGTFLVPGQVFPKNGVVSGSEIIWRVPGPVTQFNASIDVRVKPRPPHPVQATFKAVGTVSGYARVGQGTLKMPVRTFDKGVIEYTTETGLGGAVKVGKSYPFQCSEWDPEGGDIFVTLNDVAVTAVPLSNPTGKFKVPPFTDPNLEQVLSAHQKGPTVDTTVTGERVAKLELVEGVVKVTDGNKTYRRLERGDWLATGEVPRQPDVLASGNRFGLLQIDGPDGAALLNYSGDDRLLYARRGKVAVFGSIIMGELSLGTGERTLTLPFKNITFPFEKYDPIGKTGLTTITATQAVATVANPFRVDGFVRSKTLRRIPGPVELQGGILYIIGDLTIEGDVLGLGGGAIICTGNFTHKGALQLENCALIVGGTLSTKP